MYPFFRSLLFRLDPEVAHRLTLQVIRLAGNFSLTRRLLKAMYRTPDKPVRAFGLVFKNPVGLAAGYDKDAVAIRGLATLGFGHLECGTVTPRPQPGNPRPRVFRLLEDQALINRLGFPSRGSGFVQEQLNPSLRSGHLQRFVALLSRSGKKIEESSVPPRDFILGINIGKNKDTPNEEAVLDYLELLQCFAPYADYLVLNISSPNTPALRDLQKQKPLEALLKQLHIQQKMEANKLHRRVPLLVKLAPDLSETELNDAVDVILDSYLDGIVVTNTTLARDGLASRYRDESGGLSGSPLRQRSEAVLSHVAKRVNGRAPIISVGGIMSPQDAKRRLELGATLVQLYTGLIYQGPGLVKRILAEI
jgi:dihydroorotate dehydrogenase